MMKTKKVRKSSKKVGKVKIKAEMTIAEIIRKKPEAVHKLMIMGMGCVGCHMSQFETLRQGAEAHGIDVDELLEEINSE